MRVLCLLCCVLICEAIKYRCDFLLHLRNYIQNENLVQHDCRKYDEVLEFPNFMTPPYENLGKKRFKIIVKRVEVKKDEIRLIKNDVGII